MSRVSSKGFFCVLTGHLALCETLRILGDVRCSPCPWSLSNSTARSLGLRIVEIPEG